MWQDQFCTSKKRHTELILRQAQDDGGQREMEFREEQEAFPSTTWERGENLAAEAGRFGARAAR